ncbi:hypothetical protein [Ruegeria arenilitoris]|nr:hypothetical protein [Ruegeria arenilitoris]
MSNELRVIARREEAPFLGYGHARSHHTAQRVAIAVPTRSHQSQR